MVCTISNPARGSVFLHEKIAVFNLCAVALPCLVSLNDIYMYVQACWVLNINPNNPGIAMCSHCSVDPHFVQTSHRLPDVKLVTYMFNTCSNPVVQHVQVHAPGMACACTVCLYSPCSQLLVTFLVCLSNSIGK